jgi:Ca2+-binding RTX toxin-like protein
VLGGSGANQNLLGEGGDDIIRAGSGQYQFIDGGAGSDVILVSSTTVSDIVALFNNW